jgi:hypothetical protein
MPSYTLLRLAAFAPARKPTAQRMAFWCPALAKAGEQVPMSYMKRREFITLIVYAQPRRTWGGAPFRCLRASFFFHIEPVLSSPTIIPSMTCFFMIDSLGW